MTPRRLSGKSLERWRATAPGGFAKTDAGNTFGFIAKLNPRSPAQTQTAGARLYRWDEPRTLTGSEAVRLQSFPEDYDFMGKDGGYVCGMSVPPFMMQRVATEIAKMMTPKTKLPPLHTGPWRLEDLRKGKLGAPKHGLKVFSCFHCGGGSSMGYKLAGFDVMGGVEIDPEMMEIYRRNHEPRHSYLMGVQDFKVIPDKDLPKELFGVDVLDGSPPCSSFSMAGSREKAWGKDKKFREGQAKQVLDDLFFHFIDIAAKLRPKVVVAENVKGLVLGNARGYVKEIFAAFDKAGYDVQLFLLNASRMGVPQVRERTFFIARRKDLGLPKLQLDFSEDVITVGQAFQGLSENGGGRHALSAAFKGARAWCVSRDTDEIVDWAIATQGKEKLWNHKLVLPNRPSKTFASAIRPIHWAEDRRLSDAECLRLQSFPEDYWFSDQDPGYVCGMSVPPLMMQRVSLAIARTLTQAG